MHSGSDIDSSKGPCLCDYSCKWLPGKILDSASSIVDEKYRNSKNLEIVAEKITVIWLMTYLRLELKVFDHD